MFVLKENSKEILAPCKENLFEGKLNFLVCLNGRVRAVFLLLVEIINRMFDCMWCITFGFRVVRMFEPNRKEEAFERHPQRAEITSYYMRV
ncbi:MAG: hypothetical protein KDD35_09070 [Bdellovibrionales bacterium]|nr:hypothetical protein [Bdellovibrionales bacterium]